MRFSVAVLLAILFHAVLAIGLGVYLAVCPNPVTLARLDVTSVELSFAEDESDAAPVAPTLPSPSPEPPTPARQDAAPPKVPETLHLEATPPEADAVKLPEPSPEKVDLVGRTIPESRPSTTALASPVAPRQAKVDAPPAPKKAIKPDYPRGARQRGEEGNVVVELRVTARGTVDRASVVASSGFAELDDAALRAVQAARFTPAKSGDAAVDSVARMTLVFRLKK